MQTRVIKGSWTAYASSLADLVEWLRHTPRTWMQDSAVTVSAYAGWDLGLGYEGALRLAKAGWSEGAANLAEVAGQLPRNSNIRKEQMDYFGHTPDVGRFVSGDPKHMRHKGGSIAKRPIVSLAIGVGGTAAVSGEQMANYGKAMVSIIDALEAAGRRVEVTAVWTSHDISRKEKRATVAWNVKQAEDALDLAALAFSLAHPACVRRLGFAAYERSSIKEMMGYGSTTPSCMDDLIDPEAQTLILPGLSYDGSRCRTLEGAAQMAVEQINNAAGETLVELPE